MISSTSGGPWRQPMEELLNNGPKGKDRTKRNHLVGVTWQVSHRKKSKPDINKTDGF